MARDSLIEIDRQVSCEGNFISHIKQGREVVDSKIIDLNSMKTKPFNHNILYFFIE
jgi:hypothetical protein